MAVDCEPERGRSPPSPVEPNHPSRRVPDCSMRTSRLWRQRSSRLATETGHLVGRRNFRPLKYSIHLSVVRGLRVPSADLSAGPSSPQTVASQELPDSEGLDSVLFDLLRLSQTYVSGAVIVVVL